MPIEYKQTKILSLWYITLFFDKRKLLLTLMCFRASFKLAHLFFAGANIIIKLTLLLYKLKNRMRGSLLYLKNWSQSGKNKLIFGFGAPDIPQNRLNFFGNSKKNFFC